MAGLGDLLSSGRGNALGALMPGPAPGGTEALRAQLAKELAMRGHQNVDLRALTQDQISYMLQNMARPQPTTTPGIRG